MRRLETNAIIQSVSLSRQEIIEAYKASVKTLNTEASRSQRFTTFLAEFLGSDCQFYESYVQGLEFSLKTGVKTEKNDCILRGRADSLVGNLIVEFERLLPAKLEEAQLQLQKYTAIRWNEESLEDRRPYLCVATDGERFYSYSPRPKGGAGIQLMPDEIELKLIEQCNWNISTYDQVMYWLDKYFLRTEQQEECIQRILFIQR